MEDSVVAACVVGERRGEGGRSRPGEKLPGAHGLIEALTEPWTKEFYGTACTPRALRYLQRLNSTLEGKSHVCIPFLGIARLSPNFHIL
jgi:hypothetical protein